MEVLTKILLSILFFLVVASLITNYIKKERERRKRLEDKNVKRAENILIGKIGKIRDLKDNEIKLVLQCFKSIQRSRSVISTAPKGIKVSYLYSVVSQLFSLNPVRLSGYTASKENVQKLISFIYGKILKPHIFKRWWFKEVFEGKKWNGIETFLFQIPNYHSCFENLISFQFLQSYSQKVLNSLDTSSEDKLINNFFSQKDNWPQWVEITKEIKIVELSSEKIGGIVRGIWLVSDNIANRIRFKLWERFTNYLLDYFELEISNISKWDNIKKARDTIYEMSQTCSEIPELIKPVIEEILEIAKKRRKEKYEEFLNLVN